MFELSASFPETPDVATPVALKAGSYEVTRSVGDQSEVDFYNAALAPLPEAGFCVQLWFKDGHDRLFFLQSQAEAIAVVREVFAWTASGSRNPRQSMNVEGTGQAFLWLWDVDGGEAPLARAEIAEVEKGRPLIEDGPRCERPTRNRRHECH
jgi:hypothetical protein